jgi:hypothetical protein
LFADAMLEDRSETFARLPMVLDRLLAGSFPVEGGAEQIRRAFAAAVGRDSLGLGGREEGGQVAFEFPAVVLGGTKRS